VRLIDNQIKYIVMKKKICICSLIICFSLLYVDTFAQKKEKKQEKKTYEIKFILRGLSDSLLYFAYYYGEQTYMYDTLYKSPKEPYTYICRKDTLIPRGIYLLANQDKVKLMEIVVDTSTSFVVKVNNLDSDAGDIHNNTQYINSSENEVVSVFFSEMTRFQQHLYTLSNEIKKEDSSANPDTVYIEKQKRERRLYQDSMRTYLTNFIGNNRHTLFGKAQLLSQDITIPEPPKNPDGSPVDSNFAYCYYLNHYWDHMDFSEAALLYTPVFAPRLKTYYEEIIPPLVDSIIKYTDLLIEKAKDNPELFRYIVVFVTNKYERSPYVAHDAIFVHMVQKYYAQGLCPWTNEAVLERMINQAKKLSNILVGRKAPELYMADTNGIFHSNYEFNRKYTVMFFWEPNCGHCKTAMPKLVEFYNRAKDSLDFEIYAVCTTPDTVKWKQAIIERKLPWINVGGYKVNINYTVVYDVTSTPIIYVLDKEKKIIVKKIATDDLENFLRNYDEGKIRY
jgi:thiol-disulfide isomerase/thioredoxin